MCAGAQERFTALESLASVSQPEALVRELHGRLVSAAAAAGVPAALAMDVALAGALLGREAANSFGVCNFTSLDLDLYSSGVCRRASSLPRAGKPHVTLAVLHKAGF